MKNLLHYPVAVVYSFDESCLLLSMYPITHGLQDSVFSVIDVSPTCIKVKYYLDRRMQDVNHGWRMLTSHLCSDPVKDINNNKHIKIIHQDKQSDKMLIR